MHRRILLAAPLFLIAQAAHAQNEEIVVTGRGLSEGLGEDVYDVVAIGSDRLQYSASNRLEDVLRDVPGFQNFRRSDARSANPTNQGATLRALGGNASSRALLILDGVPQSDPFGGWVFWPAYDPRRLGAVRVVRGGGTGVYGPGALAGTIELTSAGPADRQGVDAELAYGSRDSVDAFASVAGALGAGYGMASASFARGDGFVPVIARQRGPVDRASPYEQASIALRAAAPLTPDVELQASGLWFSDSRERGTAFSGIDTTGTDASLRLVGRGRWAWSALGYIQVRDFRNSFTSVNAARTFVSRSSLQYNVPSTGTGARVEVRPPLGDDAELRLGGDWRRTKGETDEFFSYVSGAPTRQRFAGGVTQTLGGFAEGAWKPGDFTLTAGGRVDRWQIDNGFLREQILATGVRTTDSDFSNRSGWRPTGRAGIAWRPGGAVTLRTAAYLGWRLPTLNELYRPFRVGRDVTNANAALKPERMKGIEAGVEYQPLSTLRLGATLFANRLDDAIANVTISNAPSGRVSMRRNIGGILARGVELDARLALGAFDLSAGYSHVDARVRASGPALALDGLRPAQTPRDSLSATAAWHNAGGARAALTARYAGSQYEDDLNSQKIPDALTFDADAVYPITHRLSVEARAENVGNARVVAGISGAGLIERATPRTFWVGLRLGS